MEQVQGIKNYDEALELFGLTFEVDRVPLFTNKGGLNKIRQNEAIIRNDTKECIGVVSPKYPIISPATKFAPLKEYINEGILEVVDGGMFGKFGGKSYLSCRIGDTINVNPAVNDIIEKRIIFLTSYDGTKANEVTQTLYRLVCSNGLTVPETEFSVKFRNSKNSEQKISELAVTLEQSLNEYRNVTDFISLLNSTPMNSKQVETFAKTVLQYSDDMKEGKGKTRKDNQLSELLKTIEEGIGQAEIKEMTAYKLLNGVTCYTNHVLSATKDDVNDYVYFGTGNQYNARAWNTLREMVTA